MHISCSATAGDIIRWGNALLENACLCIILKNTHAHPDSTPPLITNVQSENYFHCNLRGLKKRKYLRWHFVQLILQKILKSSGGGECNNRICTPRRKSSAVKVSPRARVYVCVCLGICSSTHMQFEWIYATNTNHRICMLTARRYISVRIPRVRNAH